MADFEINDAATSCKHEGQVAGKPCPKCGKVLPVDPSAGDPAWKNDGNKPKNA
jgi:hypothetical protein